MSSPVVGIRTQGGKGIGLGHLRRCLTLADALKNIGAETFFVLNADAAALDVVRRTGHAAVGVSNENDLGQTLTVFSDRHARTGVTDSYDLNSQYLEELRKGVGFLAVIDDLADRRIPADMVINSTLQVSRHDYEAVPETRFLLGPSFALLRPEFALDPNRRIREHVERVLITLGGSDPAHLTAQLVGCVSSVLTPSVIDVAIGPFFDSTEDIERAAARAESRVFVHRMPEDMRTLMLSADLAITGGGQTTYELAATGTAAIAICLAENQRANLEAFAQAGTLVFAGKAEDRDISARIEVAITTLTADPALRERMSQRGRALVDGGGARRVADALAAEAENV